MALPKAAPRHTGEKTPARFPPCGLRWTFRSNSRHLTLLHTFILANAFKEGDLPLGGTRDDLVREDARQQLLAHRIGDIRRATFVDDGVSEALERSRDRTRDPELDPLTVAQLKATLLSPGGTAWSRYH